MTYAKVTHVIFDLDGTLLDTEVLYKSVFDEIVERFGKKYTKDVQMKVLGTREQDICRIIVTELELPISIEEFYKTFKLMLNKTLCKSQFLPGAEKLIRHLHKHNIPIAIATSSSYESVKLKFQNHEEISSMFHHKVSGTSDPEVKNGKPSPDIFVIAASRFDEKPDNSKCLVFEDAPNGVTGAVAAGMQCVMVPDKGTDRKLGEHATLILNSLEEFQPELFGLPAY